MAIDCARGRNLIPRNACFGAKSLLLADSGPAAFRPVASMADSKVGQKRIVTVYSESLVAGHEVGAPVDSVVIGAGKWQLRAT